jgi:orotidine-5'-phosphate decarboxylase
MSHVSDPKIVVALDYAEPKLALQLVEQLDPAICRLKVGKELFTAAGPQLVEKLISKDFGVFLDLKFHDIPTTVAKACEAASRLGVWMLNVQARSGQQPLLIAVTVLTSMNQSALKQIGVQDELQNQVLRLAKLTKESGLDGVVCSAQEAEILRKSLGPDFCLITPGIRPKSASLDDQSRVVTPAQAIALGASYLVIGRPITKAENPLLALNAIHQELQAS